MNNISGVASILAEYQKKQGHDVQVYVFNKMIYRQFGGILINYMSPVSRWRFLRKLKNDYEIWHYHYPYGSLKSSLEKRNENKVYLKHYHGDDLRRKYDDGFCLVSTPDLLEYAPNGKWLPTPIDLSLIDKILQSEPYTVKSDKVRVIHYPHYNDVLSPLNSIDSTLKSLEKENKCEVMKVFRLPYTVVLHAISVSDIVIGKMLPHLGWFGKFELEGMAFSKPIIAYVSDELYEKYKPPIYRTTRNSFKKDLESLIQDDSEKRRLGREGNEYVRKHHSAKELVNQLSKYYDELHIKNEIQYTNTQ